jgi:hypothetical protein
VVYLPGIYDPEWAQDTPDRYTHTPICCYINAKAVGSQTAIMSDDQYDETLGKLFDREFMKHVKAHRRYRHDRPELEAEEQHELTYGIDEILLTLATGHILRGELIPSIQQLGEAVQR